MARFWTIERERLLREMVLAKVSPREAARRLGTTKNAVVAKANRMNVGFDSRGLKQRLSGPHRWTPKELLPEPPPVTIHPAKAHAPHRCHVPGCRNPKQPTNPRGHCAEHESAYLNACPRSRAHMRDIGLGPVSAAI